MERPDSAIIWARNPVANRKPRQIYMLKKLWHDPVGSKVIAGVILLIIGGAGIGTYLLNGWPVIVQYAKDAYNFALSPTSLPNWIIGVLGLFAASTIIIILILIWPKIIGQDLIKRLVLRAGTEPDTRKAKRDLTAEELKILRMATNSDDDGLRADKQTAEHLQMHPQRIRHIMESLEALEFLYPSHNYVQGTSWHLSKEGRAFLVEAGLL